MAQIRGRLAKRLQCETGLRPVRSMFRLLSCLLLPIVLSATGAFAQTTSTTTAPATTPTTARTDDHTAMLQAAFALEKQAYTTQTETDFRTAADALEKCSQLDPGNVRVEHSLGVLWLEKLNDAAEAYPHLEKAYELTPNEHGWGYLLAKDAGEIGRTDRQIQVLREVIDREPNDADARAALTQALAAEAATQPVATQPATTQPATKKSAATQSTSQPTNAGTTQPDERAAMEQVAFALETQAYTTQSQADYKAAADALEKCSRLDPGNLQVERSVGFLWLDKLNDPARAYPHLEKVYTLSPEQSDWAYLLAKAAGETGNTDRQIQVLREVLKRDPDNSVARSALADATGPAPATMQAATQSAPTNQQSMLRAALALESKAYTTQTQADYQAAAEALEKCSRIDSSNDVERSVGFIWLDKLKNPAKAYPHLETVYRLSPGDSGWGSLLAKAAGELGKPDRQLEVLRDVVKHNPDDSNAHLEFAQALDKAGHHDEAGPEFQAAVKLAPDDEGILVSYGQYLHARGRDTEAGAIAEKVLAKNPRSSMALALKGDVHRNDWDLDAAQAAYQQALAQDPESEVAKTGMTEIRHSKAPTFDSSYYYFKGNDHFMQQGLYDTLSMSVSDHVYVNATYNMGYFKDSAESYPSVMRYQEGIGIEDRIASAISIRGGVEGFQMPKKEAFGYNVGVTWKPINELWIDGTYRTEDPVNDSMFTVAKGLSQDILGFTGGYQFNDDLALKFAASRSVYSDNNVREFIHVEPAYTVWQAMKLRLGAEYEAVKYSVAIPGAGSLSWYQTFGPVVEAEPSITDWLSVHVRLEFPYVAQAYQWGSNISAELSFHPGDHLTLKAGAFYVSVPESISSYSGSGFDASFSYRF